MGCTKLLWLEVRAGEAHTATPGVSVLAPPFCSPSCACRIGGRGAHTWSPNRPCRGRALTAGSGPRKPSSSWGNAKESRRRQKAAARAHQLRLQKPSVDAKHARTRCSGEPATLHRDRWPISRRSQRRGRRDGSEDSLLRRDLYRVQSRLHFAGRSVVSGESWTCVSLLMSAADSTNGPEMHRGCCVT